jgi:hypothetical protein
VHVGDVMVDGDNPAAHREPDLALSEKPWLRIMHDLNPRTFTTKPKWYIPAQSWFADLAQFTRD